MVLNSSSAVVQQTVVAARVQLDDLLAELEAGSRFVDRIERGLAALDNCTLAEHQRSRDELERLVRRLHDLRASVQQQRSLMMQLRECFDVLRRAVANRR